MPSGQRLGIPTRTIRARDGRVLVFSCEQFVDDICLGECCFVCGDSRDSKPFNDEHVIPRWLLRRFDLFQKHITLFDGQVRTYGHYKLPCCEACNSRLGERLETPISRLLAGSYDAILARIDSDAVHLLFTWCALLFLKTHLKDRSVPLHPDPRRSEGQLADAYYWPEMHHLHSVARSPISRPTVAPGVVGSMQFFKIADEAVADSFDYADLTNEQTVIVQVDDFAMVAVLNDAGAANLAWRDLWPAIGGGPISTLQLREVMARLGAANSDLQNRPVFGTAYQAARGEIALYADHDATPAFAPLNRERYGALLFDSVKGHLGHLQIDGERDPEKVEAMIRSGRTSFLLDLHGRFKPPAVVWENDSNSTSRAQ